MEYTVDDNWGILVVFHDLENLLHFTSSWNQLSAVPTPQRGEFLHSPARHRAEDFQAMHLELQKIWLWIHAPSGFEENPPKITSKQIYLEKLLVTAIPGYPLLIQHDHWSKWPMFIDFP